MTNDPVREKDGQLPESSTYYFRIAKRYRIVMAVLSVLLAIFVIFMFSVYREEITVENLRYFLRYVDTRQAEKSATTDTLVYEDIESIVKFGVYKNALAAVGYDKVQIYDLTGEAILNLSQVNSAPQLLCSDKYMMIYNLGGTTFQIYNSLSKEYEETFEYGIGCAALGDTGTFLVSTRTMEYRSVVYVYNKDFEQIYRWYTPDKLVMDASFRNGDREFMIAALGTDENGLCYTEVIRCETDKEEKLAQFRIPDEVIYRVRYTAKGGYVLIGGKAIYYYDAENQLIRTVSYGGYQPTYVESSGDQTCFTINRNIVGSNYDVTVTDGEGNVRYNGTVNGEITKILMHEDAIYLLFDRSLMRISLETGSQIIKDVPANGITLLSLDTDALLLCYASETKVIDIDRFFFEETAEDHAS